MSIQRAVFLGLVIGLVIGAVLWLAVGYRGIIHPPLWVAVAVGLALGFGAALIDRRHRP